MKENRVVVSKEDQEEIISWINKNYNILEQNGNASGKFCRLKEIVNINEDKSDNENIYNIVNKIRNSVIDKENLHKYKTCNELPDLIYYMEPGTKLHDHDDSGYKRSNEGIQIRFNVCIKKPDEGGRPIYAGKMIDLVEREYIICRAEIDRHSSEWIKGNSPKINISLGFIIDYKDIHLFSNREKIIETDAISDNVMCIDLKDQLFSKIFLGENLDRDYGIDFNKKYLLNYEKINYSKLDNYIYNVAALTLKEKFINYTPMLHKIEFSLCNNRLTGFNIEYNKKSKSYPLLSSITYLNDSDNCFMFTNIDNDSYKYKEIPTENTFLLSKIRENLIIVFDNSKYYGCLPINDKTPPFYLKINIWETDQENVDYFHSSINLKNSNSVIETVLDLNKHRVIGIEEYGNAMIYNNFIEKIFYEEKKENELQLVNSILLQESSNIITVENKFKTVYSFEELSKKYGDLSNDLLPFINGNNIINTNRFYKIKILMSVLSKDVCFWIINECEKLDKWTDSPYKNYGQYLNIEKMPAVSNFILFSANFYIMQLSKSYELEEKLNFNIVDIFISKHDSVIGIINEKKQDDSHFTLIIQLNSESDYEDGAINFINANPYDTDENKVLLKQGDMLMYNNYKLRNNGGVTKGEKYVLVLFVNVII